MGHSHSVHLAIQELTPAILEALDGKAYREIDWRCLQPEIAAALKKCNGGTTPQPELVPGQDVILKEFQPLSYLHNHLPQKAQKGIQNIDINFTCIDVNREFIVLGCNVGLVFLFDRRSRQLTKLKIESGNHNVTTVKLSSSLDDLVAAGTSNGSLFICQLPSKLPGHSRELERQHLERLHDCAITCTEWSTNGMKLYSGDEKGRVIYTAVDFYKSEQSCKSAQILTEGSAIIQLSYAYKKLLVSTLQRSVLCHTDEDNRLDQVGQKPRKSPGPYGACFIQDACKPSDATLYASRQGLRLWKATVDGAVKQTYQFKEILKQEHPPVQLLPDTAPKRHKSRKVTDPSFGCVLLYAEKYVLTWCNNLLYVLDPIQQVVVGSIQGTAGHISAVATCDDEIFLIRSDHVERPIVRIAARPEPKPYRDTERVSLDNPTSAAESISSFRIPAAADFEQYLKKPTTQDDSKFNLGRVLRRNIAFDATFGKLTRSRSSEDLTEENGKSVMSGSPNFLRKLFPQRRNSGNKKEEGAESSELEVANPASETPETGLPDENVAAPDEVSESNVSSVSAEGKVIEGAMAAVVAGPDQKTQVKSGTANKSDDIVFDPKPKKKKNKKNKKRDLSPEKEETPVGRPDTISLASTTSSTSDPGGDTPVMDENQFLVDEDATPTKVDEDATPTNSLKQGGRETEDGNYEAGSSVESQGRDILEPPDAALCDTAAADVGDGVTAAGAADVAGAEAVDVTAAASADEAAVGTASEGAGGGHHSVDDVDDGSMLPAGHRISGTEQAVFKEFPSDSSGSDFGDAVHDMSGELDSQTVDTLEPVDGASNTDSASTRSTDNDAEESSLDDFYSFYQDESEGSASMVATSSPVPPPIEQSMEKMTMKYLQFKVSDSWVQCSVPHNITFMTASDKHLWCVDNRDRVYHCLSTASGDIKWSKLKDSAREIAVSPMESIVWCVHRKSNAAYASTKSTPKTLIGSKWTKVATDVSTVCVDSNQAWIIRNNGEMYLQTGLGRDHSFSHRSVRVAKNCHLAQLKSYKGVIWGLTHDHRVFYRVGMSQEHPGGIGWKLVESEKDNLAFTCIALGPDTGWGIDDKGSVWFRPGVTAATPQGEDGTWWQVSLSDYLMQDSNVFESVLNFAADIQKPMEYVTSLWKGSKPTLIAANSIAVWVSGGKNTLHMSRGNLLGHRWERATPVAIADSARWACLSANAAASSRNGLVWALQPNGEVFCFPPNTRKPTPVIPPLNVMFRFISATPEAVWGLSYNGGVFIRAGMADHCKQGVSWKPLDLSQLGNILVAHMSCGREAVWACDTNGNIYFRMGVKPPTHASLNPAWLPVEGKPQGLGSYFTQVVVGPNDDMVWALDSRKAVYVRKGMSRMLPIGTDWDLVPGTPAQQLAVSADMVWALCPNGDIACRYGISETNPNGDYWKKIPGNFAFISATPNNHLWAIDRDDHIYQRITRTLQRTVTHSERSPAKQHSDITEEWEFL